MKLVLSIDEVGQILANYLYTIGKVENTTIDLAWHIDKFKMQDSYVEVKQSDNKKVDD